MGWGVLRPLTGAENGAGRGVAAADGPAQGISDQAGAHL